MLPRRLCCQPRLRELIFRTSPASLRPPCSPGLVLVPDWRSGPPGRVVRAGGRGPVLDLQPDSGNHCRGARSRPDAIRVFARQRAHWRVRSVARDPGGGGVHGDRRATPHPGLQPGWVPALSPLPGRAGRGICGSFRACGSDGLGRMAPVWPGSSFPAREFSAMPPFGERLFSLQPSLRKAASAAICNLP